MKFTQKDYRAIFDLAHREWLDRDVKNEELRMTECFTSAVISYLLSKGYKIVKAED